MLLDRSLVLESYLFGDIDFVFNNVMLFITPLVFFIRAVRKIFHAIGQTKKIILFI